MKQLLFNSQSIYELKSIVGLIIQHEVTIK